MALELELDDDPATLQAALAMLDAMDESDSGEVLPPCVCAVGVSSIAPDRELEPAPGLDLELDLGLELWSRLPDDGSSDNGSMDTSGNPFPEGSNAHSASTPALCTTGQRRHRATTAMSCSTSSLKRTRSRRDVIKYLQGNVTQLEKALAALKRRRTCDTAAPDDTSEHLTVVSLWRELAMRQRRQRRTAEREHDRLHDMLNQQIRIGQRVLQCAAATCHQNNSSLNDVSRAGGQSQLTLDKDQIASLDQLFAGTERVFSSPRFQRPPFPFRDVNVSHVGPNHTAIDIQAGWVVPFHANVVGDTLWRVALKEKASTGCFMNNKLSKVVATDHTATIALGKQAVVLREHTPSHMRGHVLLKRFSNQEYDDSVIVGTLVVKVVENQLGDLREVLTVTEESWTRVREVWVPVSDKESIGGDEPSYVRATQVQTSYHTALVFNLDQSAERRRLASSLTELVLSHTEDALIWRQQNLENGLLSTTS